MYSIVRCLAHIILQTWSPTARRCIRYGSVVLQVEKEEKIDVELETTASAMVASAVEGVEVVWWRKCEEEEEEGEEEEYEYEEEYVDDEEFEPRPEFDPGGTYE